MSNITRLEKFQRLYAVKELVEDNKSDTEIAEQLGMSLRSVQRNRKYLKDLAVADLTNGEIAEKRKELYLELLNATEEVKGLFEFYKVPQTCPVCQGAKIIKIERDGVETERACGICSTKGFIHFPKEARRFFDAWLEAVELRAKLYGLDTMKVDAITQLNQLNQYNIADKIDSEAGQALARMLKSQHESKLRSAN